MKKRNEKGQFVVTTGAEQYKRKYYKGKEIQLSRWLWMKHYGDIPKGYLIHHINGNKKDNRIENLKCMTYKEHNKLHVSGRTPWNKGLTVKNKKWKEILSRALKTRKKNYLEFCKIVYDYKNTSKKTYKELHYIFNRSDRQLLTAYKTFERYLKEQGEIIYNEKPICGKCGEKKINFRKGLCRKCYERQNPKSKYYKEM